MKFSRLCSLIFALLPLPMTHGAAVHDKVDICVYGTTSGGIVAAIQAARMGRSVVLLGPEKHIGGMTTSGLTWTDFGNPNSVGGMAREFYERVGRHYGKKLEWYFEPHVAEDVFKAMLAEAKVPVRLHERLAGVARDGLRLTEIKMESGTTVRAKVFIDATYEGDLLALAGVSFTVGRESAATYGESLGGVVENANGDHGGVGFDPYVRRGDPSSGLLPFLHPDAKETPGAGDDRLQAYNFRLCITKNPDNSLEIVPPAGYSEAKYEAFARYLEAFAAGKKNLRLGQFLKLESPLPNGKFDLNNNGNFSTDLVGGSDGWATATYAERDVIQKEHEDYMRGFLHFLATSSRVPANIRAEMKSWGLARDEFTDSGGWPTQLYVREARRMVSDYVMTQADCQGARAAEDSVGLGSYMMDSHLVQRFARDGKAMVEGGMGRKVPGPFPISYRSIVPKAGECENLFSTFALSASHVAFAACRMEPVFMILSQSAATAAAMAIDQNVPVQKVDYTRLADRLRADKQLLTWDTK